MKKTNLNGQILSEKEMKEVKGGTLDVRTDKPVDEICPTCKSRVEYKEGEGVWYAFCEACGSKITFDN